MSDRNKSNMAPGSLKDSGGPIPSLANMTITPHHHHAHVPPTPPHQQTEPRVKITSPLPNGILCKGKKLKKSVSFRDSELVRIREIPPRSCSGDEESEQEEDEEAVSSSDSEENSESDSDVEEAASPLPPPPAPQVNGHARPMTAPAVRTTPVVGILCANNRAPPPVTQPVSRTAPATPVSTLTVRPERAPIPWTPMSSGTGPRGSASTGASPATKVVTLVSRMTGVSSSSAHMHTKPRSPVIPASSSSSSSPASSSHSPVRKPSSPVPPKKPPAVVRSAEKKSKRITPTLDNVMTSQTVRSVQKHGAVSDTLHKGSSGKTSKKKRVSRGRQEASDRRKVTLSRKTKDSSKQNSNSSSSSSSKAAENSAACRQTVSAKRNVSSAGARPKCSVVNGFNHVRDSLSLPPLSSEDSALLNPSKLLQHRPQAKTSIYSMDGFIFPGDPTHELTTNLKAAAAAPAGEDVKLKPQGSPPASGDSGRQPIPGHAARDRVSSAPAGGSISRRKRFYAWQMANGNLQNSLHEPPSITPMWENMTPVPAPTPKPAYVTDR